MNQLSLWEGREERAGRVVESRIDFPTWARDEPVETGTGSSCAKHPKGLQANVPVAKRTVHLSTAL